MLALPAFESFFLTPPFTDVKRSKDIVTHVAYHRYAAHAFMSPFRGARALRESHASMPRDGCCHVAIFSLCRALFDPHAAEQDAAPCFAMPLRRDASAARYVAHACLIAPHVHGIVTSLRHVTQRATNTFAVTPHGVTPYPQPAFPFQQHHPLTPSSFQMKRHAAPPLSRARDR